MQARGGGSIMCTSSAAGVVGFPNVSHYVSSKHAVCGFVKTAALELAESGIRVNAINPGPIANRMMRSLEEQMQPDDPDGFHDVVLELVPMGRYGTDEEVAKLALFLGSDESSFSTGSIFMIDGGFTAA
jgi:NAD(P)-dependent dehydrogenase (short-subunit alcohol dehydrogenase family)